MSCICQPPQVCQKGAERYCEPEKAPRLYFTEREGDYRFHEAFHARKPMREVFALSRRCFPGRVWEGAFFKKAAVCSAYS